MRVLKVDYDYLPGDEWLGRWVETRLKMLGDMGIKVLGHTVVKTRRGFHAYFRVSSRLSDEEANMIQFLLGDDAGRVSINEQRIRRGVKSWNKLFTAVAYRREDGRVIECRNCGAKIPLVKQLRRHMSAELRERLEKVASMLQEAERLMAHWSAMDMHELAVNDAAARIDEAINELRRLLKK